MGGTTGGSAKPVKVILNADDLGRCDATNAAIFGLMSKGAVTSATLLANGAAFEDAVVRVRDFPRCSFGVHLNLTEGSPLTSHPGLEAILNPDGTFQRGKIRSFAIGASLHRAILAEWTAQVEKVLGSGVPVTHLDGHHHVQKIPGLFTALKRLQRRFGIRRVRITRNIYPPENIPPWSLRFSKALWNLGLRGCYRTWTTDGCTSLHTFVLSSAASAPRWESVELAVHPGHPEYEEETRLLYGEWWRKLPFEIQVISYHELPGSSQALPPVS